MQGVQVMITEPLEAVELFYSYACEDEDLRKELEKHLSMLKRRRLITNWYGHLITAGQERAKESMTHLNAAQIILLLISPDYMASDYCYNEVLRAMERHEAEEARVIPVLLRDVTYTGAPFEKLSMLPTNSIPITQWNDRDAAFKNVTQGIEQVIKELQASYENSGKPLLGSSLEPHTRCISNIPFQRNHFFTGREEVLKELHDRFTKAKASASNPIQAITGLGGIGKTQTSVEYAYCYGDEYHSIFWVRAATHNALIADFVAIANLLNLPGKDEPDQSIVVDAVKRWLKSHSEWLLIFDNVEDLAMVHSFIPANAQGHILVTTRSQATGAIASCIELNKMDADEGAHFLLRRAKIITSDETPESLSNDDYAVAKGISATMGGLPLALDQAGAYIEETRCGLRGYLECYNTHRNKLLKLRGSFATDYSDSVATTWNISFERVQQNNLAAAELLRFYAFLYPDGIPEEIINQETPDLSPVLQTIGGDPFEMNAAIRELLKYSLIYRNFDNRTLTIHPLVQVVLKDGMNENMQRQWAQRVVRAVNRVFPDEIDVSTWPQCQRYMPHVQVCAELIDHYKLLLPEAVRLFNQAASYLSTHGLYDQAELFCQLAVNICEHVLEAEHPDVAASLNNLAAVYHRKGKYKQAEPLYQRAMNIRKKTLGEKSPETVETINNLGALYNDMGKYEEAASVHQKALAIREQLLEPEHLDVAFSLNNLAFSYSNQGKYRQAEPLYRRALAIREKKLGSEHPNTAQTLSNLAVLYKRLERYREAEPLYLRSLEIKEHLLGDEHPDVATSHHNLGVFYYEQNKLVEAERHFQAALAICEKALQEHPKTATTLENYAKLLRDLKREEEATQLEARAKAIREKIHAHA
jgi:tetratricopeptide (TPR) repeat protein